MVQSKELGTRLEEPRDPRRRGEKDDEADVDGGPEGGPGKGEG